MKLRKIGNNQTEIQTALFNLLISYETPVAVYIIETGEKLITDKKWSATTTKHINAWYSHIEASAKPQSYFDNLLNIENA